MMKKMILIILVLVFHIELAFAWGKTGHRIVGEIAERHLSAKAQKAILKLSPFEDLSKISIWADEIRSDPKMSDYSKLHYVSVPNQKSYFDQKRDKNGDVIEALYRFEDILRNPAKKKEDKLEALKFLVHMIGDLHQPLHVGLSEDKGGNFIKVNWFKNPTNLHSVWDDELIDFEKLSYSEYAKYLNHFTKEEIKNYNKGSFSDWAKESMDLRPIVYDFDKTSEVINLSYDYNFKVKPIVNMRLKQAGLRLAFILNKIFSQVKLSKGEMEIREKIKNNI